MWNPSDKGRWLSWLLEHDHGLMEMWLGGYDNLAASRYYRSLRLLLWFFLCSFGRLHIPIFDVCQHHNLPLPSPEDQNHVAAITTSWIWPKWQPQYSQTMNIFDKTIPMPHWQYLNSVTSFSVMESSIRNLLRKPCCCRYSLERHYQWLLPCW